MKKFFFLQFIAIFICMVSLLLPDFTVTAAGSIPGQIDISTAAAFVSESSSDVVISNLSTIRITDYRDGDKILYNNTELQNCASFPEAGFFFLRSVTTVDRSGYVEYHLNVEPVYTVYFSVDSALGMPIDASHFVAGSNIPLPAVTVVPESVNFTGWTDKNGAAVTTLTLKEDTTLYAAFSIPGDLRKIPSVKVNPFPNSTASADILNALPKTVSLVLDNGNSAQGQITWSATTPYDPTLTVEQVISFSGTITLPDNVTNTTQIETSIKTDVTVYGSESHTYTLTYDTNGGSGDVPEPSPYEAGDRIALCSSVSKPRSKFLGWSTVPDSSYANAGTTSMTMPSHDVILYAIWTDSASHTITFDMGTVNASAPASVTVYENEAAILPFDVAVQDKGHVFTGWSTSPGDSTPQYTSAGISLLTTTEDIILYAVYEPIKNVSVSYDLSGGQGADIQDNTSYHCGDTVTVRFLIPVRENYTFLGWAFQEYAYAADFQVGGNTTFTMPNYDVTLYAVWRSDTTYRVTYEKNGGHGDIPVDDHAYYTGDTVTVLLTPAPVKDNHVFLGWASSASAASPSFYPGATSFEIGTSDVTLYAVYQEESYLSIQYDANGGSKAPIDETHYYPGDKIKVNLTDLPEYYGHVFLGWAESPDALVPDYSASSLTSFTASAGSTLKILYAVWDKEDPKHITYDLNGIDVTRTPIDHTDYFTGDTAFLDFSITAKDPLYTFKGWAKHKDAFEPYYTADDKKSLEIASEDIILYAVFESSTDIDGTVKLSFSPGTGRLKAIYEPGSKKSDQLTYTWMLGEKKLTSGSSLSYTPEEAGDYRVLLSTDRYTGSIVSAPLSLHKVSCNTSISLDNTSGLYVKGNTVNAHARIASGSNTFNEWNVEGLSLSPQQKKQNPLAFKMGDQDISLSYSTTRLYSIKVSGGVASTYSCPEGTTVSLQASNISGCVFEKWTVSGNVSLSDITSPKASFTMPSTNVTLSAIFKAEQPAQKLSKSESDKDTDKTSKTPTEPLVFTVLSDGGLKDAAIRVVHHDQGPLCEAVFNIARNGFTIYDDYYNITVQDAVPPVYETDQKIRLQIYIPEKLQKKGRIFRMICVSRFGIPYTYEDLDSNDSTITIETDRFYAYALCYSDKYEPAPSKTSPPPEVLISRMYDAESSDTLVSGPVSTMHYSSESQTGFLIPDCIGYTSVQKSVAVENAAETTVTYFSM